MALIHTILLDSGPTPIANLLVCLACVALGCAVCLRRFHKPRTTPASLPISVNYFPNRDCNKECGFCFHTAKNSFMLNEEDARRGLALLKRAGMKKLNIAGGEPFLHPKFLGELIEYGKKTLKLDSISIVSNGSKIKEPWLRRYGRYLDILAVSCDSFDEATNITIGRGDGDNVKQLFRIRDWCREYGIMFKLNTVVCRYNFNEDMAARVAELGPFRWKAFQVLKVEGENDGSDATLRDVARFEISDDEYELFCRRHRHLPCFVPESNKVMSDSYLLLDEVSIAGSTPSQLIWIAKLLVSTCALCLVATRISCQRAFSRSVSRQLCSPSFGTRSPSTTAVGSTSGPRMTWAKAKTDAAVDWLKIRA